MKQLLLFKNIDVKKLDSVLTELYHSVYAMKTFAMHQEISGSSKKAFNLTLELSRNFSELCSELSDLSLKYTHMTETEWMRAAVYNPYYAAVEPRSTLRLYEIALDYKSRSNAILLRLEAILRAGSLKVPKKVEEIRTNLKKVADYIKYEGIKS